MKSLVKHNMLKDRKEKKSKESPSSKVDMAAQAESMPVFIHLLTFLHFFKNVSNLRILCACHNKHEQSALRGLNFMYGKAGRVRGSPCLLCEIQEIHK